MNLMETLIVFDVVVKMNVVEVVVVVMVVSYFGFHGLHGLHGLQNSLCSHQC